MDELVALVARRSGVDDERARAAVGVVLRYLAGRLPSPVMGQIAAVIGSAAGEGNPATRPEPDERRAPS